MRLKHNDGVVEIGYFWQKKGEDYDQFKIVRLNEICKLNYDFGIIVDSQCIYIIINNNFEDVEITCIKKYENQEDYLNNLVEFVTKYNLTSNIKYKTISMNLILNTINQDIDLYYDHFNECFISSNYFSIKNTIQKFDKSQDITVMDSIDIKKINPIEFKTKLKQILKRQKNICEKIHSPNFLETILGFLRETQFQLPPIYKKEMYKSLVLFIEKFDVNKYRYYLNNYDELFKCDCEERKLLLSSICNKKNIKSKIDILGKVIQINPIQNNNNYRLYILGQEQKLYTSTLYYKLEAIIYSLGELETYSLLLENIKLQYF